MAALSFDDLLPQKGAQSGALSFDDLISPTGMTLLPQSAPGHQDNSIAGGLYRGMTGAGIGAIQTLNDVTGQHMLSPEAKTASEKAAAQLQQEGKGTGISGTIEEMAGNPLNWAPWKSLLAYGATAGLTGPQTNDTGIVGRATDAAVDAPIAAATGTAAKYLVGKPLQWAANKSGITDAISGALQKFGVSGDTGDLYNLAKQAGIDVNDRTPQEIADSLQNWYKSQSQNLAGKISPQPFNPKEGFKGIAGNWGMEQQAANNSYKGAQGMGEKILVQIPQLPEKLDTIISSLGGNTLPGTSEHTALQQLKNIRSTLPDNIPAQEAGFKPSAYIVDEFGKPAQTPIAATPSQAAAVPASTLMDLRANLNEGFNPKLLPQSGDVPVMGIKDEVRNALAQAGQKNPEFGSALGEATARQQNLGYSYKNNALLQKFFKPEDLTALQQNATSGTPIPDITLKRANALIGSIKTPEDMATLTKAMPKGLADSMRAAKVEDLMTKAGFDYKKLTDPDFVSLMQKSLGNNPQALQQFNVIQQIADVLKRRGINVNTPQALAAGNHETSDLLRAAWDLFEHRKAYAVRMTYRALTDENKAGLTGLQSEIQGGAPFLTVIPEIARQVAPRLVTNEMKQSAPPPATGGIGDQNMQELQKLNLSNSTPLKPQSNNALPDVQSFAKAESGGNPNARNPNSSASGLYQFTDATWAGMVKRYGRDTGISMQDKNDPAKQAIMARLLAQDNIKKLQPAIGRMPTVPEIYAAHVFGASGAARLINAQGSNKPAMMLFPKAVTSANHNLFFHNGQPRTVEQLYATLSQKVA